MTEEKKEKDNTKPEVEKTEAEKPESEKSEAEKAETEKSEAEKTEKETPLSEVSPTVQNEKKEEDEPVATNGMRPDWDFKSKDTSVDKTKLFMAQIDKSLGRINKGSLDDMVVNAFMEPFFAILDILIAYLKAKQEKLESAKKEEKKARQEHIKSALSSKKLSQMALANRVAYRTQRWLANSSMLPRNEDGSFKRTGLTRAQRFNYKKMLFAQKLPINTETGVYDFSKFTKYQKKQYAQYVMMYALENPAFKRYVESMMEVRVSKDELKKMAQIGTEMNLKYRVGQLYRMKDVHERVA